MRTVQQQPIKQDDAIQSSLKDRSADPITWTCRYKAERKLWIFRKVRKPHCPKS